MVRSQKLLQIGMMLVLKEFILSLRRGVSCEITQHSGIGGWVGGDTWRVFLFAILDSSHLVYLQAHRSLSLSPKCLKGGHLSVSLLSSTDTPWHQRGQRENQNSQCGEVTTTSKKMDQSIYL